MIEDQRASQSKMFNLIIRINSISSLIEQSLSNIDARHKVLMLNIRDKLFPILFIQDFQDGELMVLRIVVEERCFGGYHVLI